MDRMVFKGIAWLAPALAIVAAVVLPHMGLAQADTTLNRGNPMATALLFVGALLGVALLVALAAGTFVMRRRRGPGNWAA